MKPEPVYPLHWPPDWPRTKFRQGGRFEAKTLSRASGAVVDELRRLGVKESEIVISSNVAGLRQSAPQDPGVAVYFPFKNERRVLACDRYQRVEHNLWAIAKHIEAMRGMDRWGVGSLERMFTGYVALPEHASASGWREVLGMNGDTNLDAVAINAAYRAKALIAHPDRGGSSEAMTRLVEARDAALREIGG
jgi:hypothetical protein